MNFVEAATIQSSDGVNFDKQEVIPEDDERRKINKNIEKASKTTKSLRDQLSERQEEADEAKREKMKLNFQPNKAMDEEEFEFLEEKKKIAQEDKKTRQKQEERATRQFQAAVLEQKMKTVKKLPEPHALEAKPNVFASDVGSTLFGIEDELSAPALGGIILKNKKNKKEKKRKRKKGEEKREHSVKKSKNDAGGGGAALSLVAVDYGDSD